MGFKKGRPIDLHPLEDDAMTAAIIQTPITNGQRFRNTVFQHVINNRDLFGYVKGTKDLPYMFVTNDLSRVFGEFMSLVVQHKDAPNLTGVKEDLKNIIDLFLLTYDDLHAHACKCCGFYHSVSKEITQQLFAVK
jgi:hypothetical protein